MPRLPAATTTFRVALALSLAACAGDRAVRPDERTAAAATASIEPSGPIRINEIESNLGVPGDWVELANVSDDDVDVSGWVFRDDNDTRGYVLPAGTVIPARGYLVLDEAQFGFGLGAADMARLFRPGGTELADSYSWTTHAPITYGRCPDRVGAFAATTLVTKGRANQCSPLATINEIESSGGVPGDWIELYNPADVSIDVGGQIVRDSEDGRGYTIPAGTTIAAGGFLVIEESQLGFGLGGADAVRLFLADGTTLTDSYAWSAHAATTYGRCSDGRGSLVTTAAPTKGAANSCLPGSAFVRVNEVESSGGVPGDWVELINVGPTPVDVGGYVLRDDVDTRGFEIPAGTTIPAGGLLVLDEAQFGFGLGGADVVRLFAPGGATLVDSYAWTTHASTTYGRCPDGSGAFTTTTAPTKGTPNACTGGVTFTAWPGATAVRTADPGGIFGTNMSGLSFQALPGQTTGVLWAVRNGPGTLFRLTDVGGTWTPRASRLWSTGKLLRYPDGGGDVDAEGVVVIGSRAYVASERNNQASGVSRPSILLYDLTNDRAASLTAVREWNLASDLPALGPNLGLEGITFIPDAWLVANGFFDEARNAPYDPAFYPGHEGGLFLVGAEGNGQLYAYALDHVSGRATRVATFASGFPGIMELAFDAELGQLWAICDDTCNGRSAVHRLDAGAQSPTRGRFVITQRFERPTGMPNLNNEGFSFAPLRACVAGQRPAFWADDNQTGGFAIRQGAVTCSAF